ncbi:hypothetical protein [Bacillus sp. Hm123]|uniref:hypothetical protein n=1 Tax=Bacillus sp. Hm123 TaxID=3450745 RepID=UPI003F41CEC2
MTVAEFCGTLDYSVSQFAVRLSKEVEEKIKTRELFYQDQMNRYIDRRIELFMKTLHLTPALYSVYRREILHHVLFKIKPVLKKNHIFQVVK